MWTKKKHYNDIQILTGISEQTFWVLWVSFFFSVFPQFLIMNIYFYIVRKTKNESNFQKFCMSL